MTTVIMLLYNEQLVLYCLLCIIVSIGLSSANQNGCLHVRLSKLYNSRSTLTHWLWLCSKTSTLSVQVRQYVISITSYDIPNLQLWGSNNDIIHDPLQRRNVRNTHWPPGCMEVHNERMDVQPHSNHLKHHNIPKKIVKVWTLKCIKTWAPRHAQGSAWLITRATHFPQHH